MDTKTDTKNAGINVPVKQNDGLTLCGFVTAVEEVPRSWEGKEYRQLKATITNGRRSFFFVADDKREPLPKVQPFSRGLVVVEHASTDKGNVTVRGRFCHES